MPLRIIALYLTLAVCLPVRAAELDLEESLKNQAAALLRAGNFAELDSVATQLRDSSARTHAGITLRIIGTAQSVAWFDTPQKQRACDDWAFRNRSLSTARLMEHLRALPLAPLIPVLTAVAIGLLRLYRRRANTPAKVVMKPVDGMAEIGMPVDQSQGFKQLLWILAAGALAFIAAWIAFHFLK
jgi:hypothetical protein